MSSQLILLATQGNRVLVKTYHPAIDKKQTPALTGLGKTNKQINKNPKFPRVDFGIHYNLVQGFK